MEKNVTTQTQELMKNIFDKAESISQSFVGFTGATGIAGFKFDISDDEEVLLENDITDHYTEANVPVQDNIVNRPVKVTLRGLVGEYVYVPPKSESIWDKATKKLQNITEKLITIASYLPVLGDFTQQIFNEAQSNKEDWKKALNLGVSAFETYRNINIPADRQSSAFIFFEALWRSRQTFTIQTPYRFYTNMAIQTLRAVQAGDSNDNTDFEITFKQINRVATNETTNKSVQGRLKNMSTKYGNEKYASFREKALSTGSW